MMGESSRGLITVTNKEDENPSYELPETGGKTGTKVYIAGGTNPS